MICFDTSPVIWGVQGVARPEQSEMIARTRRYIKHLKDQGERIVIPAPVVTEYLAGFPVEEQESQRRAIEDSFVVPAFDLQAAAVAAQLQSDSEALTSMGKMYQVDRRALRIDTQIVAIAITIGAEKIISHDAHMAALAGNQIGVEEVPVIHEQAELFEPRR